MKQSLYTFLAIGLLCAAASSLYSGGQSSYKTEPRDEDTIEHERESANTYHKHSCKHGDCDDVCSTCHGK